MPSELMSSAPRCNTVRAATLKCIRWPTFYCISIHGIASRPLQGADQACLLLVLRRLFVAMNLLEDFAQRQVLAPRHLALSAKLMLRLDLYNALGFLELRQRLAVTPSEKV